MPIDICLTDEVDLETALSELPPGEWEVWTSNSFRRITALFDDYRHGPDGGVLHGTVQRSDGHPDLSMNEAQLRALCRVVNILRKSITPESS